jgi:hypothetical protein
MQIKKGSLVKVIHSRKGSFTGRAAEDFDTSDEFYPIILADNVVEGITTDWEKGELIPCRGSLCEITQIGK